MCLGRSVAWVFKVLFGKKGTKRRDQTLVPQRRLARPTDDVTMPEAAPSRGSVPGGDVAVSAQESLRGSVPTGGEGLARGSVPIASFSTPVATMQVKLGQVVIRSAAQYQRMTNCDVLVDLALTQRRIFTETEEDGRSEAIQSQVMDFVAQNTLMNVKSVIFGLLTQKPGSCVRVMVQSHHGKHRSVAMAEILAQQCASFGEVSVWHMAISRWDRSYLPPPEDDTPAPKHRMILRPEMCN